MAIDDLTAVIFTHPGREVVRYSEGRVMIDGVRATPAQIAAARSAFQAELDRKEAERVAREAAEAARQADKQAIRQASQLRNLLVATPNEIDARIEAQVTDLESAKEILKILARGLSLAIREQLEE